MQIIHNSADPAADTVDIYVNGGLALDDVAFRTATDFLELPAETTLDVGIAPGGSESADDTLANFNFTLAPDSNYVIMATGVLDPSQFNTDANAEIGFNLEVLFPARTQGVDAANVDFAVYHGATDAPAVDVLTDGMVLVDDLAYSNFTDDYLSVPAAEYILDVAPAGDSTNAVASFTADLSALGGGAAVVFASGFLDPSMNQDGASFGLFAALPDGAVVEFPAVTEPQTANLQVIHNSPDPAADTVDIYVNGEVFLDDFAFREGTEFVEVPADTDLNVGVAPGSSAGVDDTLANFVFNLAPNSTTTVVAAGVLDPSQFDASVNSEIGFTLSALAPARSGANTDLDFDAALYHGATDLPSVNVDVPGFGTIFTDVPYGTFADYVTIPFIGLVNGVPIDVVDNAGGNVLASFTADLSGLEGQAGVVLASGFGNPAANQDGPGVGLLLVLANGEEVFIAPNPPTSRVQIIHNSPEPTVDIYANGEILLDDFTFRDATEFLDLPAGVGLDIAVALDTSTSAESAIAVFEDVVFEEDSTYVVMATGVVGDAETPFGLEIFDMGREAAQGGAGVDLLLHHGSPDAPAVSVVANDAVLLFDNIAYSEFDGYLNVDPLDYKLSITPAEDTSTVVQAFRADLTELDGGAAVVFASGFLQSGSPEFGVWVALPDGTTFPLPLFTSVNELANQVSRLKIAPNPATNRTQLAYELSETNDLQLLVFDMQGRLIQSRNLGRQPAGAYTEQLDLSRLSTGQYQVSLISDKGVVTRSLIVKR